MNLNSYYNYSECTTSYGQTLYVPLNESQKTFTHHYSKFPLWWVIFLPNFFTCIELATLFLLVCLHFCCQRLQRFTSEKVDSKNEKSTKGKEVQLAFNSAAAWGLPGANAFIGAPFPDVEFNAAIDEMNSVAKRYQFSKIPFLLISSTILLITISILSATGGYWTKEGFTGLKVTVGVLYVFKLFAVLNSAQLTYEALIRKSRRLTRCSPSLNVIIDIDSDWFYSYMILPMTCVTYMPIKLTITRRRGKDSPHTVPNKAQAETVLIA